jgi:hypothetical protein
MQKDVRGGGSARAGGFTVSKNGTNPGSITPIIAGKGGQRELLDREYSIVRGATAGISLPPGRCAVDRSLEGRAAVGKRVTGFGSVKPDRLLSRFIPIEGWRGVGLSL